MGGFNYLPNPSRLKNYPQASVAWAKQAENVALQYHWAPGRFYLATQQKAAAAGKTAYSPLRLFRLNGLTGNR